ncbi:MAG TPA: hypothetical protein VH054_29510 [Polyangiaceae bacterium]|jgi:hypothetical protein|nr:hypothetical protein [Polyangiaceae bacterium]
MALARAERGDANGAATLLRAALELPDEQRVVALPHAESFARFGARIGLSARSVRALVKRFDLPTLGHGRGKRVIVAEALAALRPDANEERAGYVYAGRRRLRIVKSEASE